MSNNMSLPQTSFNLPQDLLIFLFTGPWSAKTFAIAHDLTYVLGLSLDTVLGDSETKGQGQKQIRYQSLMTQMQLFNCNHSPMTLTNMGQED